MARRDPKLVNEVTVMKAVRDEVGYDFSVQDAIARDYVNLSALSRMLIPKVAARTGQKAKDVREQSVVTALKRLRGAYPRVSSGVGKVLSESVVNVRTQVSKLSVERTKRTLQIVSGLLSAYQEDFIQVSESLSSITLIFDRKLHAKVRKALSGAEILEEGDEYAALIVHSPDEIISTPGCISSFYDQLSRRHVNVEDTASCYTDTILVVSMKDASRAFETLTELISQERDKLGKESGNS